MSLRVMRLGLFGLGLLWYGTVGVLSLAGSLDLPDIPWGGLFVLSYEPIFSMALAIALLMTIVRDHARTIKPIDVALVVFITPQLLGWAWVLFVLRDMGR